LSLISTIFGTKKNTCLAAESIHKKIEARIRKQGRGAILFPSDFADLGSGELVKKVLLRLEKQGMLKRQAFGIYLYPKQSKLLGELSPSLDEIAKAIATRDQARIVATGSYAMNALGLSTQVPLNAVYLTDGAARRVKVGNRNILFKKTSPKNLAARGHISSLVIQALKEMGEGNLNPFEEARVLEILKDEREENLKNDLTLAPEWIRTYFRKVLK
jgi:hypothetical protein